MVFVAGLVLLWCLVGGLLGCNGLCHLCSAQKSIYLYTRSFIYSCHTCCDDVYDVCCVFVFDVVVVRVLMPVWVCSMLYDVILFCTRCLCFMFVWCVIYMFGVFRSCIYYLFEQVCLALVLL